MKKLWKKITHSSKNNDKQYLEKQQINTRLKDQQLSQQQQSEQWTEAQAQIINHLINMNALIKITKSINQKEYQMLIRVNQLLCQQTINVKKLKQFLMSDKLVYQYYPVRSLIWKVMIGYLPSEGKRKWISFLEGSLLKYQTMVEESIILTACKKLGTYKKNHNRIVEMNKDHKDHPLNSQNSSKWKTYFEDYELWNLIEKDTTRTRSQCNFFKQEHLYQLQPSILEKYNQFLPQDLHLSSNQQKITTYYYDAITRIIFIYIKNHPQIGYWQGMNQIVALIYYSYTNKNSQYFRRVSQSDTYFTFQYIMNRLGPKHFLNSQKYAQRLNEALHKVDHKLYEYLTLYNYDLSPVTIRWLMTLFLNQFSIDECLIIWDSILSLDSKLSITDHVIYLGLGIIHLNRELIVEGANPIQLLSKITNKPVQIIQKGNNLYQLFYKVI